MKKAISLGDTSYFELFIGDRVLKEEIFGVTEGVPVYSANVFKPFGYLSKSNIDDFSKVYILWGIDGLFEFNIMPVGEVFATTDHCGAIRILNERIVPQYLLYQLRLKGHLLGYDRSLRPSLAKMREVEIDFPFTEDGVLDVEAQKAIARNYKTFMKVKNQVAARVEELQETSISINLPDEMVRKKISDLFDLPPTNSGVTKDFCRKHEGEVPVYGCSQSGKSVLGHIQEKLSGVRYYEDSLTWNRNGSVGKVFYREGIFSTNEDHRVLELKDEYRGKIDVFYVRYALENEIKTLGYGFTNKLGKSKMADIEIPIPIDEDGDFSLEKQKELQQKYASVNSIRNRAIENLLDLKEVYLEI